MTTGENIKYYRMKRNFTQKQLAEKADIAVITLQQYESGKRCPRMAKLVNISNALGIDVKILLNESNSIFAGMQIDSFDIELLQKYKALNQDGKLRVMQYIVDILKISEFQAMEPGINS